MLKTLIIAENSLLPDTWQRVQTSNLVASLVDRFGEKFPENTRIYNGNVSKDKDVTPQTEADIEALSEMEGPFYVITYPSDPVTLIAIAIVALVAIAAIVFRPKIPNSTQRNIQSESPNNALSGRTNAIRINGRIPDIFGQVRSTPDLIAVPYAVFEDGVEVEYTYMCIGRGTYAIAADDVRDGQTAVSKIPGSTVEIFGPETSPNFPGAGPQLRIGSPITRRVISALRSKSVNGQTLLASNEGTLNPSTMHFNFRAGGTVYFNVADPGGVALDTLLIPGDSLFVTTPLTPLAAFGVADNRNSLNLSLLALGVSPISQTADFDVRFYTSGRIEFQTINDIGTAPRLLNENGIAFIELVNAVLTDGVHTADLSGKYIVSVIDGSNLQIANPLLSTGDWSNLTAFAGGHSAYSLITFNVPETPQVNLSGEYVVASSPTSNTIPLVSAGLVNSDWNWLPGITAGSGGIPWVTNQSSFLSKNSGDGWEGPFVLDVATAQELILNFVALQGMYKDDGTTQVAASVDIQIGVAPCDAAGNPIGTEAFYIVTMTGSASKRSSFGVTKDIGDLGTHRFAVRARRVTLKDLGFTGQISDEVKWRDLYAVSPVGDVAFGDITTVHSRTTATVEALAVSERQINALVTRMIPLRVSGSTFTADLHATKNAAEIISFVCLDPKLGNRAKAEVNFDNIYTTVAEVQTYFGIDDAGEFSYTIDSDNLSFEETLGMIVSAVFCNAHRRGNLIEITFEKKQDTSRLLFNHRNKVPNSETRSVTFGNVDDFDGVEYEYVSPIDDALITYYIPEDRTAVKPRKVQSVGIRSYAQAYLHAWREYNRLRFQHLGLEFEATQEADLLANGDRILVADNTRPDIQDGEVESQDGLILKLSQPVVMKDGVDYVISLQLPSGIVENIDVTPGDAYRVVLATPPSETLAVDDDAVAKTVYQIVRDGDENISACLVTQKDPNSNFTFNVQAINYDARYYANDLDFV